MGTTFFEDDEILSYVEREMLGVQLIDEKPRRGGTKNRMSELRSGSEFIARQASIFDSDSSATSPSQTRYKNESIKEHLIDTFMIGLTDKRPLSMYQSNVMKFANDNTVNLYRYYRKFLEDEKNSWIDAELFEKALSGWSSTSNMQIEALERLEIAYANFKAETDHLSHHYNKRVYAINHRFEANFEQLKRLVEGQKSESDKHTLDEIERSVNTINKELPSLFDEQRLALEKVIARNEASKKKLELYFLETTNTIVKQSQNSASDNQLEHNLFAVRRVKEHAEAISLAKQAARKTFD